MPRTFSECSDSKYEKMRSSKGFGSFPYIFANGNRSQFMKTVDATTNNSIHLIKHTALRLTRTRASLPMINTQKYLDNTPQYEQFPHRKSLQNSETDYKVFPNGFIRSTSTINEDENMLITSSDILLTPFAQILANLYFIRDRIWELIPQEHSDETIPEDEYQRRHSITYETRKDEILKETCETLNWCLKTFGNIQTHRSVSDLTTIKFQKILNHELQQNDEDSLADVQFCDYIIDTFSEKQLSGSEEFLDKCDSLDNKNTTVNSISKCPLDDEVLKTIDMSIDNWGIDLFEINESSNNVFTLTVLSIFKKREFLSKFSISEEILLNFLTKVDNGYRKVPYHNSIHAADVTQSSHVILNSSAFKDVFDDLETFAVIFASAIHDIDHPGVTNQFLINTDDPLATLYNDHSVLENHHLATAFKLLKESKYDILCNLKKKEKSKFRKLVIDMVLATDMAGHMGLLADLKTMVETKKVEGLGLLNLDNYHDRIKILQCLIHCADLSNCTKPLPIYQKWVRRIFEEFYTQGDQERDLGIDISPMCDRTVYVEDKTQVGFIDYIVQPLWETWFDLVNPDVQSISTNLKENRKYYATRSADSKITQEIKDNS